MAKYEILTIVKGGLAESEVNKALANLSKIVDHNKDFKSTSLGLKDLAYPIAGQEKGWYTVYNFSTKVPSEISEFNRQAKLNKNVIRFITINLDKDYGANALANPNKVKKAKEKAKAYKERIAKIQAEKEAAKEVMTTVEAANEANESK